MKLTKNNVAIAVGIYDTVVGLWPLMCSDSFVKAANSEKVLPVGRVVGSMWASLGLALLFSSSNRKVIPLLGVASTVAGSTLAISQVGLIAAKKLPPVFLLQALAETVIGVTWLITLSTDRDE